MFNTWNTLLTLAVQSPETAEQAADAAAEGGGVTSWLLLLGVILIFVVPLAIGTLLAGALKVREFGGRVGATLLVLTLGASPFVVNAIKGVPANEMVRLGIDLAGGTNMMFQVKPEQGKVINDQVMDKMVGAVARRINPSGTEEITVRQVGADRIEVIVPGEDPQTVDEIKRRITRLGTLEFFIVANRNEESAIVQQAEALDTATTELLDAANNTIAVWLPAWEKNEEPQFLNRADAVRRKIRGEREKDGVVEAYDTEEYLLLVDPEEQQVSGRFLTSAGTGADPETGGQIVTFRFNQQGAYRFGQLTGRYKPRSGHPRRGLAIVLDKRVYSAPNIEGVITSNGRISGDFTAAETAELAGVLNAGALEVPIDPKPLSEATVDPTLGEDVRNKGVRAILLAATIVVVFMLGYYRFAGIVAVVCLTMNLVLVLGTMVLINATFTLPGLAGLVLTIGMAVDANVLIFERIREELRRGSSLRMAIRNGFSRALSTIIDANLTTLLTAVILFMIGTDTVRGFAVTLFIGIVMSMFTALFVGRLIFDIAEKKGWIKELSMFSIVGETNWDFVGKRTYATVLSVLFIAVSLAAFFARGSANYDIDFTGGTMVTFQLTEPAETDAVREVLEKQFEGNFSVERLTLAGAAAADKGRHFRLRTTESDSDATANFELSAENRVSQKVNLAFSDSSGMYLRKVSMTHAELRPINVSEDDDSHEALQERRFNGGHSVEVSFTDEVAVGTISDTLQRSLRSLPSGEDKYKNAAAMMKITGLEGSGIDADPRSVRKYSKVIVRTNSSMPAEDLNGALAAMKSTLDKSPLFDEVNTFASAVAGEMKQSAVLAIIVSLIAIVGYIWFRFQRITFGLAAVVALLHDVVIVVGMVALASWLYGSPLGDILLVNDFRINLPMVAAFLTIVGYSLNDTIVVFDRIREVRGKNPDMTPEIVNTSLNQTLSRTLLTSLTTFMVVIILYVIGGEGIHGFAFCLTLGVIVGTYSSVYVASPVLIWLMNRRNA